MIEWRGSSFNSMPRLEGGDGEREEGVGERGRGGVEGMCGRAGGGGVGGWGER